MAEPTTYIVLRKVENELPDTGPILWEEVDSNVPGPSTAAIRATAKALVLGLDKQGGTFATAPMRSWKPVTVKAEVTTTIKLEDAGS